MKRSRAPSQTTLAKKGKSQPKKAVPYAQIWKNPQNRTSSGFPKELRITHKYCTNFTIANALGAIGTYQFVANGLYDPDLTAGGHQPQYFDVCGGLYNHYTVLGSKIKVRLQTVGAAQVNAAMYIEDAATVDAASVFQAAEYSSGSVITLGLPASGNNSGILTKSWKAKQNFGQNPVDDTSLAGTITSNPSERQYFVIVTQGAGAISPASSVECIAELWFDTVWSELTTPGAN